jgi:hypothetical protein
MNPKDPENRRAPPAANEEGTWTNMRNATAARTAKTM